MFAPQSSTKTKINDAGHLNAEMTVNGSYLKSFNIFKAEMTFCDRKQVRSQVF